MEDVRNYFIECIQKLYFVENALIEHIPTMSSKAQNPDLKKILDDHTEITRDHANRLTDLFQLINEPPQSIEDEIFLSLVEHANRSEEKYPNLGDTLLIASAMGVEHYEMSKYHTLEALAHHLGLKDAVELLQKNRMDEEDASTKLHKLHTKM